MRAYHVYRLALFASWFFVWFCAFTATASMACAIYLTLPPFGP